MKSSISITLFKILPLLVMVFIGCNNSNKPEDPFSKGASTPGNGKSGDDLIIVDGDTISFSSDFKLAVYVADNPEIGASGRQFIETRMIAAISKLGISGNGANPRFFIGPMINLLKKNVTATSPTKYLNTYEITLYAVDALNQTVFASYTFSAQGVGDSPDKACINAFTSQKFDDPKFYKFLKQAEEKILGYYNKNCDVLIAEAEGEAKMRNYSAAYTILNNIPKECTECFQKATAKRVEYFQMNLNTNCQTLLSNMKAELGKFNDPSASGFNEAALSYFEMIDRQSSCYGEAEKEYNNYMRKLSPAGKRDWDFKMKEWEKKTEMADKEFDLKRDTAMGKLEYLKHKDEMAAKAEIEGNKKLLQKYNYDELPWIRKIFTPRKHVD